ncbi:hypothetical protein LEN26_010400 [Aphanomyces euteiches]|nr:hypothetical protein LEN26_010400 [Aphanomyces euteiches]KAH9196620.1 hypothetical protein AeNC1_001384 [Aphanomyces euteiches]
MAGVTLPLEKRLLHVVLLLTHAPPAKINRLSNRSMLEHVDGDELSIVIDRVLATFSSYSVEDNTSDLQVLLSTIDGKVVLVGHNFAAACIVLVKSSNVVESMLLGPFVRDMPGVEATILHAIAPVLLARPFGAATWMSFWASLFCTRAQDFDTYAGYLKANLKEEGRLRALTKLFRASKANAHKHLQEYKLPILIGIGSIDPNFSSPEAEAQYIHDTIGSTTTEKQVILYSSVKHYPHTECPDAVAADLVHFLRQL